MDEIVHLESVLNRRVLCNATLHRASRKLAYIADVVSLYELASARHAVQ